MSYRSLVALSLTSSWSPDAGQMGEGLTPTAGVVAVPQVMFVVVLDFTVAVTVGAVVVVMVAVAGVAGRSW